jgi:hypothetical protein
MQKVLLIGNDINNATSSYSWDDLLSGLISFARLKNAPNKDNKPFPLLYEEIYLNSARQHGTKEIELKDFIASNTGKLEPNKIHRRIMDMGVNDILTTNYDLTFEKCVDSSVKDISNQGYIQEILYSLFRIHLLGERRIWHIHGSEVSPHSIILGYEHYSGYLQQMRNYVATGTKGTYKRKDFLPMIRRIASGPLEHFSWVEYFFTHDVHILGLNLDFVEMHLWWLLTYRARLMVENRISIQNDIYYYLPEQLAQGAKHKLELFEVNGVKAITIPLRGGNKMAYYNSVLDKVENSNK